MNENENEWISVSEMAEREGVTVQTIRNRIKQGVYPIKTFKRGTMCGVLVLAKKTPITI